MDEEKKIIQGKGTKILIQQISPGNAKHVELMEKKIDVLIFFSYIREKYLRE